MSKLKAAARNKLPASDFALPGRRYPVNDKAHARAAMSRASHNASPAEKAQIVRKVHSKFPGIKIKSAAKKTARKRVSRKKA